ncbi:MAG TPA: hypothetical protein VI322_00515, partial [Candidatus Saccharimonadia bacterium]
MIARRVSTSKRNRSLIWGGLLLVVLLAAALAYANRHTPMPVAKVTPTTLPNAHTNDTATHAGPSNDTTPAPTVTPSNPTRPSAATLAAPTGPYLNTHSMSLSNGSTMMDSTCGGPEGATCVIVATR